MCPARLKNSSFPRGLSVSPGSSNTLSRETHWYKFLKTRDSSGMLPLKIKNSISLEIFLLFIQFFIYCSKCLLIFSLQLILNVLAFTGNCSFFTFISFLSFCVYRPLFASKYAHKEHPLCQELPTENRWMFCCLKHLPTLPATQHEIASLLWSRLSP